MRSLPLFLAAVLSIACVLSADAQRTGTNRGASDKSAHTPKRPRRATVKLARFELAAGTGLTAGILTGIPQATPTLQLNAGYAISSRLTLGAAFSQATFAPRPYVDARGVVSQERNLSRHIGLRAKGVILRRGILQVYGGLQLGITTSDFSYTHEFPVALAIEDEAAYLRERPSPFFDPGTQLGAIGFVGASVRVLRHVELYTEFGNNLALVNAGAAVVF